MMRLTRRVGILALLGLLGAVPAFAADTDSDGIPDSLDTCINDPRNNAFDRGCDVDTDGYGNVCDADFDQSGSVTSTDYSQYFVPAFKGGDPSPWPEGMDMDCSNSVTSADFSMYFVPQFNVNYNPSGQPGPTGAACAGHPFCKPNLEARMVEYEQGGSGVDLATTSFGLLVTQNEPLHPETAPTTDPDDSESYLNNSAREANGLEFSDPVLVDYTTAGLPFAFAVDVVRSRGTVTTTTSDWAFVTSSGHQVSEQTVCNRFYFTYSDGFSNSSNSPTDVVVFESNDTSTSLDAAIQFRWNNGTLTLDKGLSATQFGGSGSTALSGNGVTRDECVGEWCRFEVCLDHDEQQNDTNQVRIRGSVEIVTGSNDGQIDSVNETLPNASSTLAPNASMGLLFTGTGTARAWFDADEYIDLANYLSVQFNSVDPIYEIGPAYEIEGY